MKRIKTENNPLLTNLKKPREEYSKEWNGRGLKKMIIMNNKIVWRWLTYNELYPQMLVNYMSTPLYKKVKDKITGEVKKEPCNYPTVQSFRFKNNIPKSRWDYWMKTYPELGEAMELVKDKQYDMMVNNGLTRLRDPQIVKSVGMSEHGWSDKKETTTKQESITDDQKKKMFEEYMKSIQQKWEVLDGDALNNGW